MYLLSGWCLSNFRAILQKTTDQLEKDLSEVTRMNKNLESELNKTKDHIQFLKASSFEELVAQFQLRLFQHYNNGQAPLYDPNEMEAFAPALFTQILKSILNTGMSKDRQDTQRKRTVALMHIQ
ncbi:hypothetical protein P5673_019687 [Acropora cervicornis]|uniref:Uncharacterized protein n=1 Tax=Acropora cervicornis TaxID=6130 RepID=A0AAD9V1W9_ACRCE|nr:hypothetical protein P5673_019687 [Acropora cervicornis]